MTDKALELILKAIEKLPEKERPKAIQSFALRKAAVEGVAYVNINVLENKTTVTKG